jgi:hypothetical protein
LLRQKDKEDLEEVLTELELADEDELVPYVYAHFHVSCTARPNLSSAPADLQLI